MLLTNTIATPYFVAIFLHGHQTESYSSLSFRVTKLTASKMLAKSVHYNQFEIREAFNYFFEHLVQEKLLGIVQYSDKLDL